MAFIDIDGHPKDVTLKEGMDNPVIIDQAIEEQKASRDGKMVISSQPEKIGSRVKNGFLC